KNTKIPKYDEKEDKVLYGESSDKSLPLSDNLPISKTIHKLGDNFLVDPTREEEDISEVRITISGSNGIISSMQKGEGKELSVEEFEKVIDSVEEIDKNILKKIEKYLK
ncbi:MAG: hypothetical protein ACOC3Z_03160, partial [Nanoarchaeota archaeon]